MIETSSKYVKVLDIFSRPITFENKDSEHFKTIVGGLFTLCLGIIMIVLTFIFGKEIYERRQPIVIDSSTLLKQSRIDLNQIPIMLTFNYQGGIAINNIESLLDFQVQRFTQFINGTSESKLYNGISKCDPTQFTDNIEMGRSMYDKYKKAGIDTYCVLNNIFDMNNIKEGEVSERNFFFQNDYKSGNSTFINIRVVKCKENLSKNKTCHPDLEKLIQQIFVNARTINSFLDTENYDNPITYFEETLTEQISGSLNKRLFVRITRFQLDNDKSWIFEDKEVYNYYKIASVKQEINQIFQDNMYWLTLESPLLIKRTIRKYMKVQDLFAKLGGVFSALRIMFLVLIYHYNRYKCLFYTYNLYISTNQSEKMNILLNNKNVLNYKSNRSFNNQIEKPKLNESNNNYNESNTNIINLNKISLIKKINENNNNISNNLSCNLSNNNASKNNKLPLNVENNNINKINNIGDNSILKDKLYMNANSIFVNNNIEGNNLQKLKNLTSNDKRENYFFSKNQNLINKINDNYKHNLVNNNRFYNNLEYNYLIYLMYLIFCCSNKNKIADNYIDEAKRLMLIDNYLKFDHTS